MAGKVYDFGVIMVAVGLEVDIARSIGEAENELVGSKGKYMVKEYFPRQMASFFC